MKIRLKIIIMLVIALATSGFIIGDFTYSYLIAQKELIKSSNAVIELSMALQIRISIQHQIESTLNFITTEEKGFKDSCYKYQAEIKSMLDSWKTSSSHSMALGVALESEDLDRLDNFKTAYQKILDIQEQAFQWIDSGNKIQALQIINNEFMALTDHTLIPLIEESVLDELSEVTLSTNSMVAAIGAISLMSESGLELVRLSQLALNDLLALSHAHYYIERQFRSLSHAYSSNEKKEEFLKYGVLTQFELEKWRLSSIESLEHDVADEDIDIKRVQEVMRLYKNAVDLRQPEDTSETQDDKNVKSPSISNTHSFNSYALHAVMGHAFNDEMDEIISSYDALKSYIHDKGLLLLAIITLTCTVVTVFSISIIFRLLKSVQKLTTATNLLEMGVLDHRIHITGKDEFTQLAIGFNNMTDEIQHSHFKLEELNQNLERHVESRTIELSKTVHQLKMEIIERKAVEKALKRAKKAAEASNEAKSLFLANMSHEIRTPLNGVLGMTRFLLDSPLESEQRDWAEAAQTSGKSLLTIINDILDYSKIEANKLDIEHINFNLRETLNDMADILAISAHAKNIEFTYLMDETVPVLLKGDPGRVRQILINLGNNAIKFTEKGEVSAHVSVESEKKDTIILRFEVKDTGIGIPEDRMNLLFTSFTQVDTSTSRKYGGTGLGLAISKKLSELMGGSIGVNSTEGEGSTFWFTIQFKKQPGITEEKLMLPETVKRLKTLIIDANTSNRNVLKGILHSWDFPIEEAEVGEKAISMLKTSAKDNDPFGIVFLDIQIPKINEETVGSIIKQDKSIPQPVLIMLTTIGMIGDAVDLKKKGFDAYLTKPIKSQQLYECLLSIYKKDLSQTDLKHLPSPVEKMTSHPPLDTQKQSIRILVAEDNTINQKICQTLLGKLGYHSEIVSNGKEAVKALEERSYDIVFMDIQMPVMDGLTATRIIRDPASSVKNHEIPVIALTANAMRGDKEKSIQSGMNDYVPKPIEPDILLSKIQKWTHQAKRKE